MRALAVAVAVVAAALTGWAPGDARAASARLPVTLIGDSVIDRVAQIPAAAFTLEQGLVVRSRLAVCRRLATPSCGYRGERPPSALEEIRRLGRRVGPVVVLAVGYNETPQVFARGVPVVMRALAAGGARHVVWVTLHERQPSYAATNRVIRQTAHRWPRLVRVVDWSSASEGRPWFEPDDVHLNADGALALARLVHSTVAAACGGACATVPPPLPLQPTAPGMPRCPARSGGPWAVVLARAGSPARALALVRRARAAGFVQAVLVQPSPAVYEVVVFGYPDREGAIGVYLEAKERGLRAAPVENTGPCADRDGDWEVVFGHLTTMEQAQELLARVRAAGYSSAAIEADGDADYEVSVGGIGSTSELAEAEARALRAGFVVSFEPS